MPISITQVGFEPTIQVLEPAKAFHALDKAATVMGKCKDLIYTIIYAEVRLIKNPSLLKGRYLKELLLYDTVLCKVKVKAKLSL
jgi:hypothetical protein